MRGDRAAAFFLSSRSRALPLQTNAASHKHARAWLIDTDDCDSADRAQTPLHMHDNTEWQRRCHAQPAHAASQRAQWTSTAHGRPHLAPAPFNRRLRTGISNKQRIAYSATTTCAHMTHTRSPARIVRHDFRECPCAACSLPCCCVHCCSATRQLRCRSGARANPALPKPRRTSSSPVNGSGVA